MTTSTSTQVWFLTGYFYFYSSRLLNYFLQHWLSVDSCIRFITRRSTDLQWTLNRTLVSHMLRKWNAGHSCAAWCITVTILVRTTGRWEHVVIWWLHLVLTIPLAFCRHLKTYLFTVPDWLNCDSTVLLLYFFILLLFHFNSIFVRRCWAPVEGRPSKFVMTWYDMIWPIWWLQFDRATTIRRHMLRPYRPTCVRAAAMRHK